MSGPRSDPPALEVRDLTVEYATSARRYRLLDSVGFSVRPGQVVGIVGESGSGKSLTSLAVLGLLGRNLGVTGGEVLLDGENLLDKSRSEMRRLRGKRIRFTDAERAMLARRPRPSGAKRLLKHDTIVSPDTLLRWHRRLVAQIYCS